MAIEPAFRVVDGGSTSISDRPDWPGKGSAWRWELSRYDEFLLLAADMLEIAVPEIEGHSLAPELRAVLEDRLSQAGLPRVVREGGCY